MQAVTACCEASGLQAVPALVTKCLQLQDTLAVRFGVMLVGPAGTFVPHCRLFAALICAMHHVEVASCARSLLLTCAHYSTCVQGTRCACLVPEPYQFATAHGLIFTLLLMLLAFHV